MKLEDFNKLCEKPLDEQRYHYANQTDRQIDTVSITENYYYEDKYGLAWNKKLIKYRKESKGFCIKNGKVYFRGWTPYSCFNSSFPRKHFNVDWIPEHLKCTISLKCLERILLKKITNPNQLLSYVRSYKIRDKSLSLAAINKFYLLFPNTFARPIIKIFKDVCNFNSLESLDSVNQDLFNDISMECFVIGNKFNVRWSNKRLRDFHQKNIKEMEAIHLKNLPNETYKIDIDELNDKFTLIKTSHQLYLEGKYMSHCIYTYAKRIKRGEYIAIHYKNDDEEVTIGLVKCEGGYKVNQIQGYKNSIPKDREKIVEKLKTVWNKKTKLKLYGLNEGTRLTQAAIAGNNEFPAIPF